MKNTHGFIRDRFICINCGNKEVLMKGDEEKDNLTLECKKCMSNEKIVTIGHEKKFSRVKPLKTGKIIGSAMNGYMIEEDMDG